MVSTHNELPAEIFDAIAQYLTPTDFYRCLFVSRSWYFIFKWFLYKRVSIRNRTQLKKLAQSLESSYFFNDTQQCGNGLLIRELRLSQKILPAELSTDQVLTETTTIETSAELVRLIGRACPELRVFTFDRANWDSLQLETRVFEGLNWEYLRQFGCISHTSFNSITTSILEISKLTHLHIAHSLSSLDAFTEKLTYLSSITHLTLQLDHENHQQQNIRMLETLLSSHLQQIHMSLPALEELRLIYGKALISNSRTASQNNDPVLTPLQQPVRLKALTLDGIIDKIRWLDFIHKSYPSLESLTLARLDTIGMKWMWQQALVLMIHCLPRLQTLGLNGDAVVELFSEGLGQALKQATCPVKNLYVKSKTYYPTESCQLLFLIGKYRLRQLKRLKLCLSQDIPGWSITNSSHYLWRCTQLEELDLAFSKGASDQYPYESFLIDRWLLQLPQLKHLSLTGAKVQVLYKNFDDLDKPSNALALKSLSLHKSKVENHEVVLRYLSSCCSHLDGVSFIDSQMNTGFGSNVCRILLENSRRLENIYLTMDLVCMRSAGARTNKQFICLILQRIADDATIQTRSFWFMININECGTSGQLTQCTDDQQLLLLSDTYKEHYERVTNASDNYTRVPVVDDSSVGFILIRTKSLPFKISLNNVCVRLPT